MVTARHELPEAIAELLENAITHSEQAEPSISVTLDRTESAIELSIADDGPGIPAVERAVVTGEHDIEPLFHGSGLGLWLVNWIVQRSGGTLGFEENDPHGTVAVIRFPTAVGPPRQI